MRALSHNKTVFDSPMPQITAIPLFYNYVQDLESNHTMATIYGGAEGKGKDFTFTYASCN